MHPTAPSFAVAALSPLALLLAASVTLAGPLTPPAGPVAGTQKTLAEIEPRTAINAVNTPGDATCLYKITQPGSYYLTASAAAAGNKHGITITASNVTIDLNGFTLTGAGAGTAGSGIRPNVTAKGIHVSNGNLNNWGVSGIDLSSFNCVDAIVENITASGNGLDGFSLGLNSAVRSCIAESNGRAGFLANNATFVSCTASLCPMGFSASNSSSFTGCAASQCSDYGFQFLNGCTATGCTAQSCGQFGMYCGEQSVVTSCAVYGTTGTAGYYLYRGVVLKSSVSAYNTMDGIYAPDSAVIEGCNAYGNGDDGIEVGNECTVRDCFFRQNGPSAGGAGVFITGAGNTIDGNKCDQNHDGILVQGGTGNFIIRNTASYNTAAFTFNGFQNAAPVVTNPAINGFATMSPYSNVAF
jgi:parallel beta-helix repeat protein